MKVGNTTASSFTKRIPKEFLKSVNSFVLMYTKKLYHLKICINQYQKDPFTLCYNFLSRKF